MVVGQILFMMRSLRRFLEQLSARATLPGILQEEFWQKLESFCANLDKVSEEIVVLKY